jgi:hypothetical protein
MWGALALIAILGLHLCDRLPATEPMSLPPRQAGTNRQRILGVCDQIDGFMHKNRDLSGFPASERGRKGCPSLGRPRRRHVGPCSDQLILSRLVLTSGNEPKLAGLFARAELKRSSGAPARYQLVGNGRGKPALGGAV